MIKTIGLLVALAVLGALTFITRPPAPVMANDASVDLVLPPTSEVASLISVEHGPAASDVLWLDVVQRLGQEEFAPEVWPRLTRDAITATRFDPGNYVVFLGTGVVLTYYARDIATADQVLLEGVKHNPGNYKLWVQLGYNAYFVRGAPEDAAEYWRHAAEIPGSPHYIGTLAALAKYQAGDRTDALEIAKKLLEHAEPGMPQSYLEFTIDELESELRLERYDEACLRYREGTGRWPQQPRTLFDEGYVDEPPEDFFGYPILLDIDEERGDGRTCIARSEGVGPRQFERADELIGSQAPEKTTDDDDG